MAAPEPLQARFRLADCNERWFGNEQPGDVLLYSCSSNQRVLLGTMRESNAMLTLHNDKADVGGNLNSANLSTNLVQATGLHLTMFDPTASDQLELVAPTFLPSTGGIVQSSLVPDTDAIYDLGAEDRRFRDLYLTGKTIHLGGMTISTI